MINYLNKDAMGKLIEKIASAKLISTDINNGNISVFDNDEVITVNMGKDKFEANLSVPSSSRVRINEIKDGSGIYEAFIQNIPAYRSSKNPVNGSFLDNVYFRFFYFTLEKKDVEDNKIISESVFNEYNTDKIIVSFTVSSVKSPKYKFPGNFESAGGVFENLKMYIFDEPVPNDKYSDYKIGEVFLHLCKLFINDFSSFTASKKVGESINNDLIFVYNPDLDVDNLFMDCKKSIVVANDEETENAHECECDVADAEQPVSNREPESESDKGQTGLVQTTTTEVQNNQTSEEEEILDEKKEKLDDEIDYNDIDSYDQVVARDMMAAIARNELYAMGLFSDFISNERGNLLKRPRISLFEHRVKSFKNIAKYFSTVAKKSILPSAIENFGDTISYIPYKLFTYSRELTFNTAREMWMEIIDRVTRESKIKVDVSKIKLIDYPHRYIYDNRSRSHSIFMNRLKGIVKYFGLSFNIESKGINIPNNVILNRVKCNLGKYGNDYHTIICIYLSDYNQYGELSISKIKFITVRGIKCNKIFIIDKDRFAIMDIESQMLDALNGSIEKSDEGKIYDIRDYFGPEYYKFTFIDKVTKIHNKSKKSEKEFRNLPSVRGNIDQVSTKPFIRAFISNGVLMPAFMVCGFNMELVVPTIENEETEN